MRTDEVKISMGVMSIPVRRRRRAVLIERLGGARRIAEETVRYELAIDWNRGGPWVGAKQVWESAAPEASHHLLLQDDAWPCNDFWTVLRRVIVAAPDRIIALLSTRKSILKASERGHHFMHVQGISGTGLVMPVPMVAEFLRWEEENIPAHVPHDDIRVELFAFSTGKEPLTTIPNIIDHRDEGKSLLGHRDQRSHCYDEQIVRREEWMVPEDMERGLGTTPLVRDSLAWLAKGPLVWPPAERWKNG